MVLSGNIVKVFLVFERLTSKILTILHGTRLNNQFLSILGITLFSINYTGARTVTTIKIGQKGIFYSDFRNVLALKKV
jgi:hypothetical protein